MLKDERGKDVGRESRGSCAGDAMRATLVTAQQQSSSRRMRVVLGQTVEWYGIVLAVGRGQQRKAPTLPRSLVCTCLCGVHLWRQHSRLAWHIPLIVASHASWQSPPPVWLAYMRATNNIFHRERAGMEQGGRDAVDVGLGARQKIT